MYEFARLELSKEQADNQRLRDMVQEVHREMVRTHHATFADLIDKALKETQK